MDFWNPANPAPRGGVVSSVRRAERDPSGPRGRGERHVFRFAVSHDRMICARPRGRTSEPGAVTGHPPVWCITRMGYYQSRARKEAV